MVEAEILSVGPLQPETMGLAEGGFLCIFLRKYISCVLTIGGGRRYSAVGLSMSPSWYMALIAWVTSLATCFVWSSSSSLYMSLSERCSRPVLVYSCLSCITTDSLSGFLMISFLFLSFFGIGLSCFLSYVASIW